MDRPALDVDELRSALGGRWSRVDVVSQTGSTNADLVADAGAPDRTLLAAEDQVSGRGRLDRTWVTPPRAGLTASFLFRPSTPMTTWAWLPLLAGLAVRHAVSEEKTRLKWPNDLLDLDGRKLAGILAQTAGDAVVIGVGLNVTLTEAELPVPTASSLLLSGIDVPDRTALLAAIAESLDRRMAQWEDVGGDAEACGLAAEYAQVCVTLGRRVRVSTLDGAVVDGTAVRLGADGHLVVDVDGTLRSVGAGDVEHVRPDE